MGDSDFLPTTNQTVQVAGGGGAIEGDPLEYMRNKAKEYINGMKKNPLPNLQEKTQFKKHVLSRLKKGIFKLKEIDKEAEAKEKAKAVEEEAAGEEGIDENVDGGEDKDPFADIFGGEEQVDEATQEKMKVAQEYAKHLKVYKVQFLKKARVSREGETNKQEEKQMENILKQLEKV